jgi:hypothetical protein
MRDGNTSPRVLDDKDNGTCASCRRIIYAGELYGAHGLCTSCLETECRGDGIGGE